MQQMLIVEDEPDLRECLRDFFSAKGFDVMCATGGDEAIEWLQQHAVEILLLDVNMPGFSGIEVLRFAKQLYPEVKAVMVTGVERKETEELARQYGAIAYVTKPFDFSDATWAPILQKFTDRA